MVVLSGLTSNISSKELSSDSVLETKGLKDLGFLLSSSRVRIKNQQSRD